MRGRRRKVLFLLAPPAVVEVGEAGQREADVVDHDSSKAGGEGLGGALLDDQAVDDLLQQVVQLAKRTVAARSVSITVLDGGGYRTSNSSGVEALAIDQAQYDEGDGPCLEAIRTSRQLEIRTPSELDQWPAVAQQAAELGVAGVLSTPLVRGSGSAVGALNLYSTEAAGFNEDQRRTAQDISRMAAVVIGSTLALAGANHLNDQLREAMASREVIGQAMGILMERQQCTQAEAFDLLRRGSQRENRKLRGLAEEIVHRREELGNSPEP